MMFTCLRRRFSPEKTPRIVREMDIMDYMDQGVSDLDRSENDFARGGSVSLKYNPERINQMAERLLQEA